MKGLHVSSRANEKVHEYKTISINGVEGRVICDNTKIAKLLSRKEDDNGAKWSD